MRQRQKWTKEQKAEFWKAFIRHRDEGCSIRETWSLAYKDFQAEGKLAPGLQTFANWYRKAMRPQEDTDQGNPDQVDTVDNVDAVDTEAEETAEETAPDPDYTRRLELMCRLYRSRSEYNIDSLCDYLLPDLCAEEE